MAASVYAFHLRIPVRAESDGANHLVAGIATKRIAVIGYQLTVSGDGLIVLQDTTAGTPTELAPLQLIIGCPATYSDSSVPAFVTGVGEGLDIVNPSGVNTYGHLTYIVVD